MRYYTSEIPAHVSGRKLVRHLDSLVRAGVTPTQISALSGVEETEIESILSSVPSAVPFSVADQLYDVTTADKPLDTPVDREKVMRVFNKVADNAGCQLHEVGQILKVPTEAVDNLLQGGDLTLREWQTVTERLKKLKITASE